MQLAMPKIFYTEGFINDVAQVETVGKRNEIRRKVDLLSDFPDLGSSNLPRSITVRYGNTVRKLIAPPFLIVYEYHRDEDAVYVLGLDHQRSAW